MTLQSEIRTIKSITTWRYEVALSFNKKGLFYITYKNLLTKEFGSVQLIDYNNASFYFESRLNSFEGN